MAIGLEKVRFTELEGISAEDVQAFRDLAGPARRIGRGTILRHQGSPSPQVYILLRGWTACSIVLADGGRQIVKLHLPGDIVGMSSLASPIACETIHAISDAEVAVVDLAAIGGIFRDNPRLAALLFLIAQEERVILMDRLASIGRTCALSRIAALILQLHERVRRNDPGINGAFAAPLTQSEVGDLTGLTPVHVNRVLRQLRVEEAAVWAKSFIRIIDKAKLARVAGLPPSPPRDTSWIPARA